MLNLRPKTVVLCGSTRFKEDFVAAALRETLAGLMVLSIGCDQRTDAEVFDAMDEDELRRTKAHLDVLHLAKIDAADEVLILNRGGYVGESTYRELVYACMRHKPIRWLEPDKALTEAGPWPLIDARVLEASPF